MYSYSDELIELLENTTKKSDIEVGKNNFNLQSHCIVKSKNDIFTFYLMDRRQICIVYFCILQYLYF